MKGKKLRATLAYPALFEPEPDGGFTVTFPEAGIAATYGPNWDAARAQAEDMLEEAILGMIAHGEDVPWPASVPKGRRRRPSIPLPAPTAAKLEIYRAMRAEGLGAEQLAQRLGWEPAQVTRLFGRRAARLDHIEAALRAPACRHQRSGLEARPRAAARTPPSRPRPPRTASAASGGRAACAHAPPRDGQYRSPRISHPR